MRSPRREKYFKIEFLDEKNLAWKEAVRHTFDTLEEAKSKLAETNISQPTRIVCWDTKQNKSVVE